MRLSLSLLTIILCCIALGCGDVDNSVEKPTNPVPPPKNATDEPGTTTSATP